VRWEGVFSHTVSQVCLNTLLQFLEDKADELHRMYNQKEPTELLYACLSLLLSLLSNNQPIPFLLALYPAVRYFLSQYGDALFASPPVHKLVTQLAGEIFKQCSSYNEQIRSNALSCLYMLLRHNFSREHKLSELEITLTVDLSRVVATLKPIGEKFLRRALLALPVINAKSKFPDTTTAAKFEKEFSTLLSRLNTILADSMEITRQTLLGDLADPTTSEALLLQVADAFSHMPETRVTWLNRLADHHKKKSNHAEAGQCYILIADICRDARISFGVAVSLPVDGTRDPAAEADAVTQSIILHLEKACQELEQATLYEQCHEVYKKLLPYYEMKRNYKKLSSSYQNLHTVFESLIKANANQDRMLGTYYRVGFYGRKFGPRLDGNEFIYKMPRITRLMEIVSNMKKLYTSQLGAVRVLPDSGPVDKSKLDPEECVMQVTFVDPYFPVDERNRRREFIDRTTGLSLFAYSTPFTKDGKPFGSVTEQYKRNTVLSVKATFPFVMTAQLVHKREETVLEPIDATIEDVQTRIKRMGDTLEGQVDQKQLTGLLAGSVATQVHGGAKEVCTAFLNPVDEDDNAPVNGLHFNPASKDRLRAAMREFIQVCQRGLDVNRKLCATEADKSFQANLDQNFDELRTTIWPFIKEKKKKLGRVKKGVHFG